MGIQSFFSSASGLEAHSTWLDVIGNNISNANTVAYKSSRLQFADQLSASLSNAQGADGNLGGVNAKQSGTGTRVSAIDRIFTQGANLQTTRNLDLAIQGDGFFVVEKGDQRLYTRAGNLDFDGEGYLVDPNGGFIQGIMTRGAGTTSEMYDVDNGDPPFTILDPPSYLETNHVTFGPLQESDAVGRIRIETGYVLPAKDTTSLVLSGNLDANQKATFEGGILDLNPNGRAAIPLALALGLGTAAQTTNGYFDLTPIGTGGGFALHQLTRLSAPVMSAGVPLSAAQANDGNIWQDPDNVPAARTDQTVYDPKGNERQISILFYQVNDLGDGGINSTDGPSQAAYAWYAFDTTGGANPSNANLVAGTGILEGEVVGQNPQGYNRGIWGDQYVGDLLYFGTDGSLASPGASSFNNLEDPPRAQVATAPRIYLPARQTADAPEGGDGVATITISFGTLGQRDGVRGMAEGETQGGQYVGHSYLQLVSQDGYAEGTLIELSISQAGVIEGNFTNGQTGVDLARISMARFSNPEGLSSVGGNYYTQSANSGPLTIGFAGEGTIGTLQSGALEASNVDLGLELTNMIIAQRSYDANSRTLGVSNENWQTAIGMKR